jgi:hypothetical protein
MSVPIWRYDCAFNQIQVPLACLIAPSNMSPSFLATDMTAQSPCSVF